MLDARFARLTFALFLISGGKKSDGQGGFTYIGSHQARVALFAAFGVSYKGDKIPKDAEGTYMVQGYSFRIARHVPRGRKTSAHRVFIKCPMCDKEQPIGRLEQHAAVHDYHPNSTLIIADQPSLV